MAFIEPGRQHHRLSFNRAISKRFEANRDAAAHAGQERIPGTPRRPGSARSQAFIFCLFCRLHQGRKERGNEREARWRNPVRVESAQRVNKRMMLVANPAHTKAMTTSNYQALITQLRQKMPALLELANRAGAQIMAVYHAETALKIELKEDNSPVTVADIRANDVLMSGLASLFPDIPVVSEEVRTTLAHRDPVAPFWLIDPLDGTREFINRTGQFTVNLALVIDGYPVAGVITTPAVNEAFWAIDTVGAFEQRDGVDHPMHAAAYPQAGLVRVLASQSHMSGPTREWIDSLGEHELQQAGSSLKFCRLAQGRADVYPRLGPTCEWDTAAGQAILEVAGGAVFRLDGSRLSYGTQTELNPSFVATGAGARWPLF